MTGLAIGGIVALFVLIALGMPIAYAMLLVGAVGFGMVTTPGAALNILGQAPFHTLSFYEYVVIPLFVLMGMFAWRSGVSRDLFSASFVWFGARKGGLALSGIFGCGMFSAICGSSMPTAATMGLIALPEMKERGYDMRLATGSIAAGGTLGVLVPPSLGLVVYGIITEESIGRLFLAAFLPGLLMLVLFFLTVWWLCRRNPDLGPAGAVTTPAEKARAFVRVLPTVVIFSVCIIGIYAGIFSPVESAAIGAFLMLAYGLLRGTLDGKAIAQAVSDTSNISLMIFAIMIGAAVLGYFISVTQVPLAVSGFFAELQVNRYVVFLGIVLMYMVIGCVLDFFAMMILTLPIIFPTIQQLGFDPIWFGVVMVVMLEIGQITPPIGINVFTVKSVAPDVPLMDIFRGVLPFWVAMLAGLAIMTLFPQIVTVLPNLVF